MGERPEEPDRLPGKLPRLLIDTLFPPLFSFQAAEDNQQPLLELSQSELESMQWWTRQQEKKNPNKTQIWPGLSVTVAALCADAD